MNKRQEKYSEWLSAFSDGCHKLGLSCHKTRKNDSIEWNFTSDLSDVCPLKVSVSDIGGLYVKVGRYMEFEDEDQSFDDDDFPEILEAVFKGNVEERLFTKNGRLLRSDGKINLKNKCIEKERVSFKGIFLKPDKEQKFHYKDLLNAQK